MTRAESYRWVILAVAFLAHFASNLAISIVPPLAPLLQSELALTKTEIGLFSSAALAGTWAVLFAGGYWAERFGVRRAMALSQLVAGGIILTMTLAGSFVQAVVVMLAVGLASGVTQPAASKAVMDWFPAKERATAMGIKQTGYPLGGILMSATVPALALALGWRLAIALAGLVIMAGGVFTAVLYRTPAGEKRMTARGMNLRLALGQLLRNPRLWALSLISILMSIPQMGLATYLALYLNDVVLVAPLPDTHDRVVAAGLFLAIMQAGGVVGRVSWGVVSDRLLGGQRMPGLALVGAIAAVTGLLLAFMMPDLSFPFIALLAFMAGAAMLGWSGLYHALVVESVTTGQAAMGVGLSMTFAQAGTVAGPPLFGFIVDMSGAYQVAWLCMALSSLASCAVAALCSRTEDVSGN